GGHRRGCRHTWYATSNHRRGDRGDPHRVQAQASVLPEDGEARAWAREERGGRGGACRGARVRGGPARWGVRRGGRQGGWQSRGGGADGLAVSEAWGCVHRLSATTCSAGRFRRGILWRMAHLGLL